MNQSPLLRRRKTLVATATIAMMCLAPTAQALTGDAPAAKGGSASDPGSTARKTTVKEQKSLVATARANQAAMAKKVGLPAAEGLRATDVVADKNGAHHIRYDRTYQGLRVIGGDILVHAEKGGSVTSVQRASAGKVKPATTKPSLSKAKALKAATKVAPYKVTSKKSELVVFARDGKDVLAYDNVVEGVRKDQTPSRLHVIVDAATGKTLTQYDEIHSGTGHSIFSGDVEVGSRKGGDGFELVDPDRGDGETIDLANAQSRGKIMTNSTDEWGDGTMADPHSAGVDAAYGAAETWDYYLEAHDRTGIFDDGVGVPSRVHYGNEYVNAFWDGQQMTYGDGVGNENPLTELDVAAHEMSHGVTEATAGLVYTGDAGGLNEATSDIFGTAVEFHAENPEDVGDYMMGEEIDINGDGTPLRYMDEPSKDGASYDCWDSSISNDDPHYTSGPGNHFFYLASEGSGAKTINGVDYDSPTCDGSDVEGIGREKAAQVWFRALSTYMTSTTTYPEARDATVNAAIDIYGGDSAECAGIEAAWNGIAVPENGVTCANGGLSTSSIR
ncbi:MAG: M4 family metallopeptidase [Nocardioides sp.]|nr:M4 family metallopeptidase [Nocardioides sp.]